jgi:hypothetical protein
VRDVGELRKQKQKQMSATAHCKVAALYLFSRR